MTRASVPSRLHPAPDVPASTAAFLGRASTLALTATLAATLWTGAALKAGMAQIAGVAQAVGTAQTTWVAQPVGTAQAAGVAQTAGSALPGTPGQGVRPDPSSTDPVLFWNDQVNRAIQVTSADAFHASRALALESVAVFDTVRSLDGGPTLLVRLSGPRDVEPGIAATAAAHAMLSHLFPSRHADLDTALEASLARAPAGPARDRALAFGKAMAEAVIAMRDRDGWDAIGSNKTGTLPGQWRPTPPAYLPPMVPQWAALEPFVLISPGQFRPPGPPGPGTAAFREATAFVAAIGGAQSAVRTAAQTEIAHYWSDAIGSYAPAGHWNAITASLLTTMDLGLDAEAELFAKLNIAMADAAIAVADAKYTYWFWRPITVIRSGGGGAPPNPDWSPLLVTPNHPGYISGHSAFSGAAAEILTARFGARPFSFASTSVPGATRSFASFQQAAEEAAFSRVLGGIHFAFENVDGLATGRAVGNWTLSAFRHIAADRAPVIVMDRPSSEAARKTRGLAGFALDNFAPVTAVTVRPAGRVPFTVVVDDQGRFEIPRQRLEPNSERDVLLTASSVKGRTTTVPLETNGQFGAVTAPVTVQ